MENRTAVRGITNDDLKNLTEEDLDSPVASIDIYWHWLREGWKFRYSRNEHMHGKEDAYHQRILMENDSILPRGFVEYFLMLSYLVRWAKERKIPVGPARGSAAASLVCYLLRITEVDPMQFPTMIFARFIDPKRLDLPDVDLDFADDRRDEVRLEAVRVFGSDRVGNIGNFTRYRGKNSLDDVARVYNIPNWETEKIKDLIIDRSGGDSRISDSLQDTFDMFPAAQAVIKKHPELQLATRLEGNYRGLGVHAAGLVISNTPITETCAVYSKESNGRMVSVVAYDKKDAEYLGMLKADFLGLKTMGAIGIALNITGMDLEDLYAVPLTEPTVLRAFKENDVTGIFQFEGRATRLVCADVKPDHFMHLADINALSRPGPLFSGMTAAYTEVRHGRKEAEKLHPIVDAFTDHSYGQIVYQEQVLGIIRDLGGFPVQRVGDIRKIISQKLGEASFQEMYAEFESGAKKLHGVEPALAKHIWKFMVTSATYSFNIAHCVTSDTIVERPRAADNLTIGQIWRALNKFEHGANGGPDAAMGISFAGPCMACGVRSKFYRQKQCSKCHNIRLAHKLGRLKGLSIGDDGLIRPNKIEKVFNNGVQGIHLVTLEDGASMRVTGDHSWMNSSGGWTATDELKVGDDLLWFRRYSKDLNDQEKCGPNYWKLKRRDKSKDVCSICSVARPNLDISHKDGLHSNDRPGNLWILCRSCHTKYDRDNNGRTLGPWTIGKEPSFNRVAKIERDIGREEVFTLQMSGDVNHNYITGNGAINKNCVSYSMLAFWLQWLKQYEPVAFYAAQLEKVGDGKQEEPKRAKLMRDAVRHGVSIRPPSFLISGANWTADRENNSVLAGFTQVKGIGPKTSDKILEMKRALEAINGQGFQSWGDLEKVSGIGPKTVEKIIDFADKEDPFDLELVGRILGEFRADIQEGGTGLPRPTHTSLTIPREGEHTVTWMGIVKSREYKDYIEDQRARTGDSLEEIKAAMKDPHLTKSCTLHCYDDGEDEVYIRFNRWAFPKFQAAIEGIDINEDIIIVTGKKKAAFGISLHATGMVVIVPNPEASDEELAEAEEDILV